MAANTARYKPANISLRYILLQPVATAISRFLIPSLSICAQANMIYYLLRYRLETWATAGILGEIFVCGVGMSSAIPVVTEYSTKCSKGMKLVVCKQASTHAASVKSNYHWPICPQSRLVGAVC